MMMESLNRLRSLPDGARVWIYAADRPLNDADQARIIDLLDTFCRNWHSHGRLVDSAASVLEGRFALIAGDIPGGDISGCGIDASVHALSNAAEELGMDWLPALFVHFRDQDGSISSVSRARFRELVESETVTARTPVFDLSIETLDALRSGRFEQPAENTWHGRMFRLSGSTIA